MSETDYSAKVNFWEFVRSCAADNKLSALKCCTELIDNALDWEANHVTIEASQGKHLRVRDNGLGIENMDLLVKWGGHHENKRKRGSGFYGVGMKDAALSLGGSTSIVRVNSSHNGVLRRAVIEWERLKTSDNCMRVSDSPSDEPSGTSIEIIPLRQKFPEGVERRQSFAEDLGYIYSPALKNKQTNIFIKAGGTTIDLQQFRWKLPELTDLIHERIVVGKKTATVHAGIVPEGVANTRPGLTYMHRYRVVKMASRAGCGRFSTRRVCGYVEVEQGWDRTRNKDDLLDAEDLYEAVELRLGAMLAKADTLAHRLETDEGLAEVESALAEHLDEPSLKAKRKRTGKKPGTVVPRNTEAKHTQAENTQPGDTFRLKRPSRCVKIEWDTGWKPGNAFGHYEVTSKVRAITLYEDHPLLRAARDPFDPRVIFLAAMTLIAHGPLSGQLEIPRAHEILGRLADATSRLERKLDGSPILAQAAE